MDVCAAVERLPKGSRVQCLPLCGTDLGSPRGLMTMMVTTAVAEFERDLLVERTQAGLALANAQGNAEEGRRA